MLEKVMNDLGLKRKELVPFELQDPFNPENHVKGFVSQKPDHRYGAVAITHVNGKEQYQIHFGTPKQHYPFGKTGQFHFPKAEKIEVYEKLDGTNICAYRYFFEGRLFRTYKIRKGAFVRNSRWGNFIEMWKEMLEKYPQIPKICELNKCNVSFEMYGSRNTHLIQYKEDLEAKVLFGVNDEARIFSPSTLDALGVPTARLHSVITNEKEFVSEYKRLQEETEKANKVNDDNKISGSEGFVWYLTSAEGDTIQFKCKPESIEQIHFQVGGIETNVIIATAHNVLETEDEITYEATADLLAEEFTEEQILRSEQRIRNVIEEVKADYKFRDKVLEIYNSIGISIRDDKRAVMREMSKHFSKYVMGKVYSVVEKSGS